MKRAEELGITRPTHRNELPLLIPEGGVAMELGVAKGEYSEIILALCPKLWTLYSIDRWTDHHDEGEYQTAYRRLNKYGDRSIIIRDTFANAVDQFEDEMCDFIYIDGYAHTGQEGGSTLEQYWPKLKKGGWFCGHDFHEQFPETIKAVVDFCEYRKLTFALTTDHPYPSWYLLK